LSEEAEGLHYVRATRPGKPVRWYVYAWRGGPQIMKSTGPKRPKLTREAQALLNAELANLEGPPKGTILWLSRELRSLNPVERQHSPEWDNLAAGTQRTWGAQLDVIENKWGKTPLAVWSDPRMVAKVVQWRDSRKDTARTADIGVQVLDYLLEFGRLRGHVLINVARDIPTIYRGADRAEIIWTDNDIQRFSDKAHEINRASVVDALMLAAYTGLRRQDLVTLTWAQVGEFAIVKKALKRSARKRRFATMPRIPALDELLAELRTRPRKDGVETVLVNSRGRPWSGDGLNTSFGEVRNAAAIVHVDDETGEQTYKRLHDVRGTFATHLCVETDLSDKEIGEIMSWSPERIGNIRRRYVDQSSVIVAIGARIANAAVKRPVKRSNNGA
jgi:integrase